MLTYTDSPVYEIYALKYAGPLTSKLAMLLWMEGWDEEVERNYYIWAIKGEDGFIIVDTGCRGALARERRLNNYVDPAKMLASIGANRENVKKVVPNHIHFDHVGRAHAFSMVAWMESYDKLRARAPIDLLFPGHDKELFAKYPLVAEGVTRLA